MVTGSEIVSAILKGTGFRPTSFLLRWAPAWNNPFHFDLVDVIRCEADGGVVTSKSQRLLALHAGHRLKAPSYYSILEVLKLQIGLIG